MRVSMDVSRSRVCSRAALARVWAGAKREPVRAKHQEAERGLKPRDYILDCSIAPSSCGLEESFSRPHCADGADIFQKECEAKTAFDAGADIELADFEVQAIAVCVIAELRDRTLEE